MQAVGAASGRCRSRTARPTRGRRAARAGPSWRPSSWLTRRSTAARPIVSIGWRTVVSGGSVYFMNAESSKPTTDTSPGTSQPASARGADRAEGQRIAGADDRRDAVVEQLAARGLAALGGEHRPGDPVDRGSRGRGGPRRLGRRRACGCSGTWSDGPRSSPMCAVAEGDEVVEGLLSGHRVVARHRREVEPRRRPR